MYSASEEVFRSFVDSHRYLLNAFQLQTVFLKERVVVGLTWLWFAFGETSEEYLVNSDALLLLSNPFSTCICVSFLKMVQCTLSHSRNFARGVRFYMVLNSVVLDVFHVNPLICLCK